MYGVCVSPQIQLASGLILHYLITLHTFVYATMDAIIADSLATYYRSR